MIGIKEFRKKAGVTQHQLSESIGVNRVTVARWETGERTPAISTAFKISQVLGCTIDDLVRGETDAKGKTSNGSTARG